jgi:hypothetical protein
VDPNSSVTEWQNGGAKPGGWIWLPKGEIAAGVGSPGTQIQFADFNGDGRADYLDIKPTTGAVRAWLN